MSDYIKRADAIEAVRGLSVLVDDEDFSCFEDALKALPSADAVEVDRTSEWVAVRREEYEDLIADAVSREEYEELYHKAEEVNRMANEILAYFPSYKELVSVVRCKDCRHYEKHETWSACTLWTGDPYEQASVIDDDFCSYGERREP